MERQVPSIRFRLDSRSGTPPFRQLVEQVINAVNGGRLTPGDRLPSVREVVTQITINPNTVHRAYRELEHLGVTQAHSGLGTYISSGLGRSGAEQGSSTPDDLISWIARARIAGLTDNEILDMVCAGLNELNTEQSTQSVADRE
jgi:GntR family transcriptional regulator